MAYQPGYAGLLNAAWPRISQYEAATGRRINKQFVQGLLGADLANAKQLAMDRSLREQALAQQANLEQQRINLLEHQQALQNRANMVSGYGQIAQLPIAYGAAKSAGFLPKGFELTSPSTWLGASTPVGAMSPAAGAQAAIGAAGVAGGAQAPLIAGTPMAGAAYPGIAGGTALPGVATEASLLGGTAPVAAGLGMTTAAGAAGGLLGKGIGHYVAKPLGINERTAERYGGIAGGAAVGFAVGGPIGAFVGAGIGFLSSLF